MITKITISNVASYKEETSLETKSKVNLIYGLNGSGKTTISNYLYDLHDLDFENCSVKGFNEEQQKILVYNQRFVEDNFYEQDVQKGIFTLAEENKQALQQIKDARQKKGDLQKEQSNPETGLYKQREDKKEEIENATKDAYDRIWEAKQKYTGGDRIFDNAGFFTGLKNNKDKLFNHLSSLKLQDTSNTLKSIEKELQELGSEGAVSRQKIQLLKVDLFKEIESDPIFQEEIIGSQNSSVAALIENLGNSDWVRQGLGYVSEGNETCPFCQEDTLTGELQREIRSYFDETYERKIQKLRSLQRSYEEKQKTLKSDEYQRDYFDESQRREIVGLFRDLENVLKSNLTVITGKITSASQGVSLKNSKVQLERINAFVEERNEEIDEFNQKIRNHEATIRNLKDEFWQVLRKEYDPTIAFYAERKKQLEIEKERLVEKIDQLAEDIHEQDKIISDNQNQTINLEQTIEEINNHLLDFGIEGFKIIKHDQENYRIRRVPEQGGAQFKSLSEGEKIIISFLYFMELCKGKESREDMKSKIVVIDDPISSLSHMYVFNVAELIKKHFLDPKQEDFIQCFILTHSWYFFHELVNKRYAESDEKDKKGLQKFFRITKKGRSFIEKMKHSEIKNDYEFYWDIVKDASQENMPLMANAMRNIVEYFFGFMDKSADIKKIFRKTEFSDSKFQSFKRYMDRESHSDPLNISDYKEFEVDVFREAFKQMFASHPEHYEKYMGTSE